MKKTGLFMGLFSALVMYGAGMSAAAAADDREAIYVSSEQRNLVLSDMRNFLVAVQDIVLAMADGDMATVSDVARSMGPGMGRGVGMGMGRTMNVPMEFRQLGRETHMAFSELAQAADIGPEGVLTDLGTLMSNCTACHVTYKFVVKP